MQISDDRLTTSQARRGSRGFTLIELLVVIALSGLILALLLTPLIKGFQFTNRAKALVEAQDATRFSIETVKRELASAAYIFDNSRTPIVLPLGPTTGTDNRPNLYPNIYPGDNPRPTILYGLIDLLPPVEQGQGANTAIDPTTGRPLGGNPLILPGAASARRMVRYFVALRNNLPAQGQTEAFYQNVYEFPRTDNVMNTFILYRAEFNPQDANLIDTRANAYAVGGAGLHDPNFFYNTGQAANGRTYAQNWRAIASPILGTTNLDVLAWRRENGLNTGKILSGSPFQMNVGFTPSAVIGDTATPGFLSNTAAETPGAVPSLYSSKYGQWTLPFAATFYRSPARGNAARENPQFGSVHFTARLKQRNGLDEGLEIVMDNPTGVFTTDQPYYWLYDVSTGKYIVHTANLTFQLDPARGRVETAFAPLATNNGVPLFRPSPDGVTPPAVNVQPTPLVAGVEGNYGTLVTARYRKNTRDTARAGQQYEVGRYVPANQGILVARLDEANYYDAANTANTTAYPSLWTAFGSTGALNPFGGLMIVPGSETVVAPDNNLSVVPAVGTRQAAYQLVTYFRVPALTGSIRKTASILGDPSLETREYRRNGLLNYRLETDLEAYNRPFLQFDEAAGLIALDPTTYATIGDGAAGLPAPNANGGVAAEVQVAYLWQNNYARDTQGRPITSGGQLVNVIGLNPDGTVADNANDAPRPEADVVKVDYSTRSQINVILGARVYDTSSGTPQAAQVTDKVVVNNANR